jgi:hypothetical protein
MYFVCDVTNSFGAYSLFSWISLPCNPRYDALNIGSEQLKSHENWN